MFRKKSGKKAAVVGLCICMVMSSVTAYAVESPARVNTGTPSEEPQEEKDYIVMAGTEKQVDALEQKYDSPDVLNDNSEDCLQENQMASLTLTDSEAERLSAQENIEFIEEDIVVTASETGMTNKGARHKKKVAEKVQKEESEEWNLRMIHAGQARKMIKKKGNKGKKDCGRPGGSKG